MNYIKNYLNALSTYNLNPITKQQIEKEEHYKNYVGGAEEDSGTFPIWLIVVIVIVIITLIAIIIAVAWKFIKKKKVSIYERAPFAIYEQIDKPFLRRHNARRNLLEKEPDIYQKPTSAIYGSVQLTPPPIQMNQNYDKIPPGIFDIPPTTQSPFSPSTQSIPPITQSTPPSPPIEINATLTIKDQ